MKDFGTGDNEIISADSFVGVEKFSARRRLRKIEMKDFGTGDKNSLRRQFCQGGEVFSSQTIEKIK